MQGSVHWRRYRVRPKHVSASTHGDGAVAANVAAVADAGASEAEAVVAAAVFVGRAGRSAAAERANVDLRRGGQG